MIQSTFVLLKGIGERTERRLWENGVPDWQAFLSRDTLPGIAPARKPLYDAELAGAIRHLDERQARYFTRRLKPRDHWRLYGAFRSDAVYLDIETTGQPAPYGQVTVVGLYANGRMTSLVLHESLTEQRLADELSRYRLIVTYFGSVFDLPYLRATFPGLVLDQPHFDLCFAARHLGLRGGLKHLERLLGVPRPAELHGLDGWEAVRLWEASRRGDPSALDLLLRYNESDTRNLEPLADLLYDRLTALHRPAGRTATAGEPE
ncbi:MAG: ribonuclease H-like domain-containing protein [Nitrospirota bacterium]